MGVGKRGNKDAKHVRIYDAMQASAAWKALSGNAVKLLLHVAGFDDGKSNGHLFMSEQAAADAIGVSRNTAARCFNELEETGFLACSQRGGFSRKTPHASTWRMTWTPVPNRSAATNEWRDWRATENQRAQKLNAARPKIERANTLSDEAGPNIGQDGDGKPPIPIPASCPNIGLHTVTSGEAPPNPATPPAPDTLLPGGPKPTARQALGLGEAGDTRECQRCGTGFVLDRADRAYPRLYCSIACRKGDERDRERNKRRVEAGKEPTDTFAHLKRGTA